MKYTWEGVGVDQEPAAGEMDAAGPDDVRVALERAGVRQIASIRAVPETGFRGRSVSVDDTARFCAGLANAIRAGHPLPEAMEAMAADMPKGALRETLGAVASEVREGVPLSRALSRCERFPELIAPLALAGQRSGKLAEAMEAAGIHAWRIVRIKKLVTNALLYPAMVVVIAVAVMTYIFAAVVPEFEQFYGPDYASVFQKSFYYPAAPLPISWWIVAHIGHVPWIIPAFAGGAALVAWFAWRRMTSGHGVPCLPPRLYFRAPVVGGMLRAGWLARFARTMELLLRARVPALEAVQLMGASMQRGALPFVCDSTMRCLQQGGTLSEAFLMQQQYFPAFMTMLVQEGERTGQLPEAFARIAEVYEEEAERECEVVAAVLPPVLMILLGLMLVLTLMGMLGPLLVLLQPIY